MRKTTVYLDEDLRRALARTAKKEGRSEAEIIRDALRQRVLPLRRPRPRSAGVWNSGDPNLASRDEELLAEIFGYGKRPRRR
ncbi:MAG: ribbon-helix-helix domain-containing protein [Planctomycetes bacterium]|nr:ribbon-helix-helix domain-containing protein [Planctomycetota bacterium]